MNNQNIKDMKALAQEYVNTLTKRNYFADSNNFSARDHQNEMLEKIKRYVLQAILDDKITLAEWIQLKQDTTLKIN
jgi:hypothetical protein